MERNLKLIIYKVFLTAFILFQTGCFLNAKIESIANISTGDTSSNISAPVEIPDPYNNLISLSLSKENVITWSQASSTVSTYKISFSTSGIPSENCNSEDVITVSATESRLSNLTPDTTYYYRICSAVDNSTSKGITGSFKTLKYLARSSAYNTYSNWNDYLLNNGTKYYNADQTVCPGNIAGINGFNSCINGGLVQKIVIPQVINCNSIKAFDGLSVFKWSCDTTATDTIIYSTELNSFKGLQDLISGYQFKDNYVVVQVDGINTYSSASEKWWTNVIEELPDSTAGGTLTLTNGGESYGKIYIASQSKSGGAYRISENKISIVVKKGIELKKDSNAATSFFSIANFGQAFLWFEGSFNGNGLSSNVFSLGVSVHMRLHNIEISNFVGYGIAMNSSYNAKITDFHIHHGGIGIYGASSIGFLISNGKLSNSDGHVIDQVDNSVINNLVLSANESSVVGAALIYVPYNSIITNVTAVNNLMTYTLRVFSGNYTLYHSLLNINTGDRAIYAWNSAYVTFSQIMSFGGSISEIYISNTTGSHKFTNNLVLENSAECVINNNTGNSPGLVNGTCANHGPYSNSNLVLATPDYTKFFAGKTTTDDVANPYDNLGLSPLGSILNWIGFDNFFRFWGQDGGDFPNDNNKGFCAGNCRIWDYRLKADVANLAYNSTNAVTSKNEPFIAGSNCPSAVHGNKVTTYTNSVPTVYTFLTNAAEIIGDGLGNENSLCESGESCIYNPNFGAYQGEGDFYTQGTCTFQNGTISNVKLYSYPIIGI